MESTTAFGYYSRCWSKYIQFSGRSSRAEYWYWVLINVTAMVSCLVGEMLLATRTGVALPLSTAYLCLQFFPNWAVSVRRLHDMGKSGWWILFGLVPVVGIITLTVFTVLGSEPGENRYGPNPKDTEKIKAPEQQPSPDRSPSYHVAYPIGYDHLEKATFPILSLMLCLNLVAYSVTHFLTFGAKVEGVYYWEKVIVANGWLPSAESDRVEVAYELTNLFPESYFLETFFQEASWAWRVHDGQNNFLTPMEKELFFEVQAIPASDAKANYLGYQRLLRLRPGSEFYLNKMKFYRSI